MKKPLILLLMAGMMVMWNEAKAYTTRSLEKGDMVFGFGTGYGIYKTTMNKTFPANSIAKDTAAAAIILRSNFEYALLDWLGAGVRLDFSNYLRDAAEKKDGKRTFGFSSMATLNAHFLRTRNIDMFVSGEYGYSHFNYTSNQPNNAIAKAGGAGYSIGLGTRFYFGRTESSGINLHVAYEGYNYRNGVITDTNGATLSKFGQKGKGIVFEVQFQFKN